MKKVVVFIICLIFMVGCSDNQSENISYTTITSSEAYEIINTNSDVVILDVRTSSEYQEGHIKNSINVPLDRIEEDIINVVSDKDKTILVYCKSGNRSKSASEILIDLGYKNVNNFGGINNWKYEIVKD